MCLIKTLASKNHKTTIEKLKDFIPFSYEDQKSECFKMKFVIKTSHIYYVSQRKPQQGKFSDKLFFI